MASPRTHIPARIIAVLIAAGGPFVAAAQPSSDENASHVGAPADTRDRQLQVGLFSAYTPVFTGSRDYQLIAAPNVQLRYDRLSLSIQDGLTYDVIRGGGWRAGPSIGLRPGREEDGGSPFAITGGSDALLGLGTIKATADVGGYVAFESGRVGARLDLRQATNSDLGLIATLGLRYSAPVALSRGSRPAIISIGPRLSLVDDKYSQSYFGVTDLQSVRSGLPSYRAKGGLMSAGVGATAVLPLNDRMSGLLVAGYDRLAGDAARSPLVENRGSRNQAMVALGLSYKFGL